MRLMERIKNLSEKYIVPIVTGGSLPYMAPTAIRLGDEQHSRAMEVDEREHSTARPPFGIREINWADSRQYSALYCLGFGASAGLAGGIISSSLVKLVDEQDPKALLATLGAIVVGNVVSYIYERVRR